MMTPLQIVLAIVGVSLIAAIVIYNLLQERRFRKEAEKMFSHQRENVVLGDSIIIDPTPVHTDKQIPLSDDKTLDENAGKTADDASIAPAAEITLPSMEPKPSIKSTSILSSLEPIEPGEKKRNTAAASLSTPAATLSPGKTAVTKAKPNTTQSASAGFPAAKTQISSNSGLDVATEYIARIKFVTPTSTNLGTLLTTLRRIGKPLRALGRRADGVWETLTTQTGTAFEQVEFGLQLADRSGALSPDQLDEFTRALYDFAAEEGGAVTCSDKAAALDLARDLDLFCMDVDVLIGLNVVSADSRPFTSEAMHKLALDANLSLEPTGLFHALDDSGHTLFTLSNQGEASFPPDGRGLTTRGVTLLFDVPRVADGLAVFDRMTQLGFDLAVRLEGRLVDDNGRIVSEESLNRDRQRLIDYYRRMEMRGIPPGGERSLRLFV
jgi:FtsZ-interacting cell division protein ZipA